MTEEKNDGAEEPPRQQQSASQHAEQALVQPSEVEEPADQAVSQKQSGHKYNDVIALGDSRMAVGDYVAPGGQKSSSSGHEYNNVSSGDQARLRVGDSHGGKSVFDD